MRSTVVAVLLLALASSTFAIQCNLAKSCPLYKQCDSRWGNDGLGSSSTICKVGCLMSSVSSAMAGWGKNVNGQTPNPQNLNAWLKSNGGYQGNLFMWGAVAKFGLTYEGQPSDLTSIKNAVCTNKIVILNVNQGGHWVLATSVNDSGFGVNDSGYLKNFYNNNEVSRAGIFRA